MSVPPIADTRLADGTPQKRELVIVPAFSVALQPGEQVIPLSDGKTTTVKVSVSSNLTEGQGALYVCSFRKAGGQSLQPSMSLAETRR